MLKMQEAILNMYWEHRTKLEIAVELDISEWTVTDYINRARRRGDERANRRTAEKRLMQADARRKLILELSSHGYGPAEIAGIVNCHLRLVQMRLKEAFRG